MAATFSDNTPGLVAILNNRPDFERAREQHWYSIPVPTAPDDILKFRWVAFYLTQAFEHEKWSIRYWTEIKKITRHRSEKRCQERMALSRLDERAEWSRYKRSVFLESFD